MGELTFFLGLQMKQKNDGIFISQDKYVVEILKKFEFIEVKNASKPMETQKPMLKDEDGEEVDVHMYQSTIGSLMYLTSSTLYLLTEAFDFWSTAVAKTINGEAQIHARVDGKKATPNESSYQRTDLGGGPRCQEAIRDTIAQTSTKDDAEMFDVNDDLGGEEVFVARQIEKVIEEVVDVAQGVDATQEYYKLYLISLINSCYHTVFYMAQQIVPAD
nr:uncharacterized mitochondrial protein AtMg00810-like [Tanacetum cinerariifolium]